jgi:membrane protease YdiL (CAAX protease family)
VTEPAAHNAGRDALLAFLFVGIAVAALVHVDIYLPAVGHLGSALVAVTFIYVPVFVAWRRGEYIHDYGLTTEPARRGLITAAGGMLLFFPIFIGLYFLFYEIACSADLLRILPLKGTCSRYGGLASFHWPHLTLMSHAGRSSLSAEFCAVQLVVVALPEELFFRGMLLGFLEKRFPPKRRILGGGVGLALLLSACAFALIHLPKDGDPRALATFLPGLLFGWMRSATGSILASTLTHAGSNILARTLDLMFLR